MVRLLLPVLLDSGLASLLELGKCQRFRPRLHFTCGE